MLTREDAIKVLTESHGLAHALKIVNNPVFWDIVNQVDTWSDAELIQFDEAIKMRPVLVENKRIHD